MSKVILILNIIALVISIVWMINSNYEFEPVILSLTLIATLIGIVFNKDFLGNINQSAIKGNKNIVHQGNKTSKLAINRKNKSGIDGDENEVKQDN